MKKSDITYIEKLNELMLDVRHPNNRGLSFVLVEGDSDIRLFRKFFNLNECKVECIPGGNSKVEDATEELVKIYKLIIGIRDSDFIILNKINYTSTNMFLTDFHDLEMTLIADNDSFSSVIFEYTDKSIEHHNSLRDNIIHVLESVSLLKWLNEIENLEINFKDTGFQNLISFIDFKIDFEQYFNRLLSKSPDAKIKDFPTILEKVESLKLINPDPLQLCNGHDFIKTISQFLRTQGNARGISEETVSSIFRINYTIDKFKETKLYSSINNWAIGNGCNILNQ